MSDGRCKEFFQNVKNKVWRWERYKTFFQVSIFRYFVLWFSIVPMIAVALSNVPGEINLNFGGQLIKINAELPFSWQLLWLSSLFFVIALGIYYVFCPAFIKKYNDYGEYLTYNHDYRWMAWEACHLLKHKIDLNKFTGRVLTKKYAIAIDTKVADEAKSKSGFEKPIVEEVTTDFYFENDGVNYKLSFPHYIKKDNKLVIDEYADKGMFHEIFGRYSESSTFARSLIIIFLSLSLALFLVVLMQHIYHGATFFIDWACNAWVKITEFNNN